MQGQAPPRVGSVSESRSVLPRRGRRVKPVQGRQLRRAKCANCDALMFIGAMEKLANQNLAEVAPERWVEILLYSHPPIGKRIRRGEEFAKANG